MSVFSRMAERKHEQVIYCNDAASGLRAIIAIHDTTLGPSIGGCRMWPYASEAEALTDALRLSEGMTYKNAAMGLDFGGAKAVIIGDPKRDKSEALLRAFGRFVASLNGRYITAEDVSIDTEDIEIISRETEHVIGRRERSGNPAVLTAYGLFIGMQACLTWLEGTDDLSGRVVAVQGIGQVGWRICERLHEAGARLIVADLFPEKAQAAVEAFGAEAVGIDEIWSVECDIFSPCALGGILNDETIPALKCKIVAGSANNQLAELRHAAALKERGILYAPDYVINGGGVINASLELDPAGYNAEKAYARVATIYDKLTNIFKKSEEHAISTAEAAARLAEERIERIHATKRFYVG